MPHRAFVMACLLAISCSTGSYGQSAKSQELGTADWIDLFNGEDLSGWVLVNTPPETWKVQDRMLICSGKPTGEIRTAQMYQNFILEVEWRHMVPGGNAGIFVWADDITARGVPFHRSIEVQVLENAYGQSESHTTHGDIFPIHGAKMVPVHGRGGDRAFPTESRSKPSPEWNHYRITCQDGKIALEVNGKLVTEGHSAWPRKGYICLESEGGVVHYRGIRIRVLPDTDIPDSDVAQLHRGFQSQYSGLDLRNWNQPTGIAKQWLSQDWVLRHVGAADPIPLESDTPMESVEWIVDVSLEDETTTLNLAIGGWEHQLDAKQSGMTKGWNRLQGRVSASHSEIRINASKPQPMSIRSDAARTWRFRPSGKLSLANLYTRPQPE